MSSGELDPRDSQAQERSRRIQEIADEFLQSLHKTPNDASRRELLKKHPDLAPELERRLRFVESVFLALQSASYVGSGGGSDAPTGPTTPGNGHAHDVEVNSSNGRDRVVSIRCPHCGNQLKLVTHGETEVTCGSCGSAVSVDPDGTRTDARSRTPKFIAHFKILSQLGQGSFGTAYKAEDTRLSRNVAIKIPRAGSFATSNDELRFVREARHAAQLRHPNIVQVHEIANDHGVPYLVSDFIDGITLSDLISGRRLTYRESAEMMITIADAVQFAHEHHVIHRDLKPSNILLDASNKPHIADFGLARQTEGEFTVTLEGEILGTPAYMSPEQASGKEVDVRTDVYSLGVMLYRLVCGELPFRGSQRMMLHQVLHDDPKSPRRLDERVPRDLDTIILKAMAKERERRYQTAADFSQDLRNWLRSQPIIARPVGIFGKTIRWCRRNPSGAFSVAGACVLLFAIAALAVAWGNGERKLRRTSENLRKADVEQLDRNGIVRMQNGDMFGALPWLAKALELEVDSERQSVQRLRIGMIEQAQPTLTEMWSPGGEIKALEFSGDGNALFVASNNGAIQLCKVDSGGAEILQGSSTPGIAAGDFDPTGERIATTTGENKARLWDARTNKHVAFLPHDKAVWRTAFSPDGKWVATTGEDHRAKIWNASDGSLLVQIEHPAEKIDKAIFSPDSQSLLTISRIDFDNPCELRLWDVANGELRLPVMAQPASVRDAIFDKSGKRIFAACDDGSTWVWNVETGQAIGEPFRQGEGLQSVYLIDDEKTLITVSVVGKVTNWDLAKHAILQNNIRTDGAITSSSLDKFGKLIAVANEDCVRVFWQYCGLSLGAEIPHGGQPLITAFHPDGRRLAVAGDDGVVRLWDLAGLAPTNKVLRFTKPMTSAAFDQGSSRILVGGADGATRQFSAINVAPVGSVMQHDDKVVYCEFDADGTRIITASNDGTAQIWDASSGNPIGPRMKHSCEVLRAKFIPGSDRLITTTMDGTGSIWNIGADQPLHRFTQDYRLLTLAIHPDRKSFAVSGDGPFLQIRKTEDGLPIGKPIEHTGLVATAEFSPSGKKILTASYGGSVAVSNLDGADYSGLRWNNASSVLSAKFARGDGQVLTADVTGNLTLWQEQGSKFRSVWSHSSETSDMQQVDVNPTQEICLAASNRVHERLFLPKVGSIRLHDLANGLPLSPPLIHYRPIWRVRFSPDGKKVVTASEDGSVRIWDLKTSDQSVDDLQRLASLLNASQFDEIFQIRNMDAATQQTEFEALRNIYPEKFACTADEIASWNEEVQWVFESQQKWLDSIH